ncbi:MAG: beta-propeller fold lactonase family protein [Bacteroidetes bacterium]|nr:beta-propeller fold lactonase family protein [Bacteroidota bacterium]
MKKILFFGFLILLILAGCSKEQPQKDVESKQPPKEAVQNDGKTIKVGKGPDALFLTSDEKILYVANVEDNFISVINTETENVVGKIEGIKYPWGFSRLGNSDLVAVSGYDKQIVIINFKEHKIVKEKKFNNNLGGITSTKDGKYIYVIETGKNKALKLDAASLKILDSYETGNGPDGIGISKDDSKIYTTNTKDGTISVINIKTKKSSLLEVGGKPELVHYNHDRSLLFISNFKLNKIHIIDTNTDKIIHEITDLKSPEEAVLSKSEDLLYVVNFGAKKVFVYHAVTYQKLKEEYIVGNKPIGVISALNDSKLFVSNYGDNTVSVLHLTK